MCDAALQACRRALGWRVQKRARGADRRGRRLEASVKRGLAGHPRRGRRTKRAPARLVYARFPGALCPQTPDPARCCSRCSQSQSVQSSAPLPSIPSLDQSLRRGNPSRLLRLHSRATVAWSPQKLFVPPPTSARCRSPGTHCTIPLHSRHITPLHLLSSLLALLCQHLFLSILSFFAAIRPPARPQTTTRLDETRGARVSPLNHPHSALS